MAPAPATQGSDPGLVVAGVATTVIGLGGFAGGIFMTMASFATASCSSGDCGRGPNGGSLALGIGITAAGVGCGALGIWLIVNGARRVPSAPSPSATRGPSIAFVPGLASGALVGRF